MNYFLTIQHADGRPDDVREIDGSVTIPVTGEGNLILVDENGQPAAANLTGFGEDLVIGLNDGVTITLEGFYAPGAPEMTLEIATYAQDGKESVDDEVALVADQETADWQSEVEGGEGDSAYQFNGTLGGGALGFGSGFTLMRFSNTEYIDFGEPSRGIEQTTGFYQGTPPVDRDTEGGDQVEDRAAFNKTTPTRFVPVGQPITSPTPSENPAPEPYRAPVAVDDAESIHAGDSVHLELLSNDSSGSRSAGLTAIEGKPVSPGTVITLANGATVTVREFGKVTYEPNGAFKSLADGESAVETFEYTISDGVRSSTATVTIDIAGKNDAPDAVEDAETVHENGSVTFNPLDNDSDPDNGDSISLVGVEDPALGSITQNRDGTLTYETGNDFEYLAEGESATQTFTYTIEDNDGVTDTATITITIEGKNDGPTAVVDHSATQEEIKVNLDLIANDTDPDTSDVLTITALNGQVAGKDTAIDLGDGATVTLLSDGTVDYQPAPGTNALDAGESLVDSFTYTISDGNGGTSTATANVTIHGVDDPIKTVDDHAASNQTGAIAIDVLANDSDPDTSDVLKVQSVEDPDRGTTTINPDGTIQFDPGSDFTSLPIGETTVESFTYTVSTPDGDTDTATVYVTVTGENDGPTAVADHASTLEQSTVNVNLVGNDTDPDTGDSLSVYEVAGISATPGLSIPLPSGASVVLLGNDTVNYTAAPSTNSLDQGETLIDTFDYIVTDETGATSTATANITINGVDDPIVTIDDVGTTNEGSPVIVNVLTNDSDPDASDTLTVTGVTTPGKGAVSFDPNGQITFNPDGDFENLGVGESATETVTYTVATPDGDTASATLTITITGSNDGPIATNEIATTNEETLVNIDVLANETDPDTNDVVSLASIEGQQTTNPIVLASGATVTVLADGTVNYQPAPSTNQLDEGESAVDSFDYVVRDGSGATATATTTITINGVDDPIVAVNDTGSGAVGSPIVIDVLANDSDPDTSDTLSVSEVSQPDKGETRILPDGTVSYDPGDDFVALPDGETATETFTYTVTTPDGDTETATVTVTITGGNDGPTAVADNAETVEQVKVNLDVIDNDTDPDGDTLSVSAIEGQGTATPVTLASGATVTLLADGTIDYTPAPGTNSLDTGETLIDTFEYTAIDPNGATSTTTATVTINGVDDAIVALDDEGTTNEGSPVTVNVLTNDSDPDTSDTLTVTEITSPRNGKATHNPDGTITYDPDGDFEGLGVGESATEVITYTVTTPDGDTETATLTVTVTGVNDGPTASDESTATNEQTKVNIDILANDSDPDTNDSLSIQSIEGQLPNTPTTLASGATVTVLADGTVDYQPAGTTEALDAGETAIDSFDYIVVDESGATSTATATITINGVDDPINAQNDVGETNQSTATNVNVLANDSDPDTSDTLQVTGVSQPDSGKTTVNPDGSINFDPKGEFDGLGQGESAIETVTYTVETPDGDSATATLTVTINGQNDDPNAVDDEASTLEETKVNIDLVGNDTDTDTNDTLSVQSIDGKLPNTPVTLTSGATVTLLADGTVDYQPAAGTNALDEGESAIDTFDYVVTDQNGGTATATATITINGVDDPIVAINDSASSSPSTPVVIDVLANDSDPDTSDVLSVDSITQPTKGKATLNPDGTVTYDPDGEFEALADGETATETFNYTVSTPDGDTETATVTVTITGGNDGPTAVADNATTLEQTVVNIDLVENDTDPDTGDTMSVRWIEGKAPGAPVTLASGAVVTLKADGTVDYQPAPGTESLDEGETAIDTFEYTVEDESGATSTATATVTINGVDDPITANDEADTTTEATSVTTNVLANDSDPDTTDGPLSVKSISQPRSGSATLNSDGTITFDPNGNFESLAVGETSIQTIDYIVENTDGDTETATLAITVTGLNDGPAALDESTTTNEQTLVNVDVLANDSDLDGDTVALQSVEGATAGTVTLGSGATVTIKADGTVDYTPAAGTESLDAGETAIDSFSYVIEDGNGGSATATTTVTINGVDDPISALDDSGSTNESTTVNIDVLANDSDPDTSDTLAVIGVTQPDKGTTSVNPDGTINFNPNGEFEALGAGESATETVTYTVETPDGDTATATLTVTINGENDGPTANDEASSTNEVTKVNIDILANDTDPDTNDSLSIQSIEGSTAGSVTLASGSTVTILADGTVDYQPASGTAALDAGETAIDTFDYVVVDESGATSTATTTVTINGVENPISAVDDFDTTSEDTAVTTNVLANDSDPDTSDVLSVTAITQPANGKATLNPDGTITFDPDGGFEQLGVGQSATETVTYTVETADGNSETAILTITVTGANDGPVATDEASSTNENVIVNVDILSNDTDPDLGDSVSIQSIDGELPTNLITLASGATVTVRADGTIDYNPALNTGDLDEGESLVDSFDYVIVDENGATATATTTISINGVDDPINARDDQGTTDESTAINVDVLNNDSDPDTADTLTVTGVTQPGNGTTSVNPDGTINFNPNGEFEGLGAGESATETVTYTVETPDGDTATATLTVTINGENDGPVAVDDDATTLEETKVNLDLLDNDTDADTNDVLTIQSIENQPTGAPITLTSGATVTVLGDGTVDYKPAVSTGALDEGESLVDTFDYVVSDGNGGTATATATVTINGVDDPILAVDDEAGTNPGTPVVIDVLANDSDPDTSDVLTISSVAQPVNGSTSIVDGKVVFNPDGDFDALPVGATAVETFTYVVSTPDGDSETATVSVTVTGGNDGPTANADNAITDEQVLVNLDLLENDTDPDTGDTLAISWIEGQSAAMPVTLDSGATVTLKPDGTVDYTPADSTNSLDAGETLIDTFEYTIEDESGVTSTATATITINGVDDPLVANDEADTTDEASIVTTDVLANDSDPDASDNALAVQSIVQPDNGSAVLNPDGTISFDPDGDFEGLGVGQTQIETIDYVVVNQDGETENATLTITVSGINDDPTASDESATTNEQTKVNVDILDNDSDIDGDTISIQSIEGQGTGSPITLTSGATVTVLADGTVDYQPAASTGGLDAGETFIDTFEYVVQDGNGGSATATTTITINGIDDPLVAVDDADTTNESTAINIDVLANDSDPDTSDTLAVIGITAPTNGTVSINPDGTVKFDPNGDFEGLGAGESATETLTYTVETPDGDSTTAALTVTITGQNDDPNAVNDAAITTEETLVNLDVLDNDTDADTNDVLTIQSIEDQAVGSPITLASGATVTVLRDGTVDYQPAATTGALDEGETFVDSFDYIVSDGKGGTATATATVTVNGIDDPLVALDDNAGTNPDSAILIDVLANDSDPDASDTLTIASVVQPTNGTVSVVDGKISFDPDGDFDALPVGETAVESFTYVVTTPDGDTETATVNVTVTGGNDAPTAVADSAVTDEQVLVNLDLLANDTDPDTGDTLSIATIEGSEDATVTLASGATVTLKPDGTVDYQPAATTDALDAGESFIDTFEYTVTDESGATATATATVTINGVDDPLAANDEADTTDEATAITTNVLANDSDADASDGPLAVQSITQPGSGSAVLNPDGTITFDPNDEFEGLGVGETQIETIDYVVVNQDGATENATLTVTVSGINDGPVALDESTSTFEETLVNIDILNNDSDVDGDTLTIQSIEGDETGTVTLASGAVVTIKPDGTVDYQPAASTGSLDAGETTIDSFDYVISDGEGGSATATAMVTVNGVDDPIIAQDDERTTDESTAIDVDLLANDSDADTSDTLAVTGVTAPTNGTVKINPDGTINYNPNGEFEALAPGESATETMTYTVETPDGDSTTATLTVTITGQNDDPDAVNDAEVTNELQTVNVDLVANDTDVDNGDSVSVTQLNGQDASGGSVLLPSGATVTLLPDGTVDYQPAASTLALNSGETAIDTFTYVITDENGGTATATATITINGITVSPPEAVDDNATTTENTLVNIDILDNDSETDPGDSFSLQTIEGNAPVVGDPITLSSGAVITLKSDGTIDYQPAPGTNSLDAGESTLDTFDYTIVDTQGNSDSATATITINGEDDPLVAQNDADSTTENATTTFNVLSNDSDADTSDNALVLSAVTDPVKGSISFDANGEITFDPGADFNDLDSGETAIETVTYTITNQDGSTATATHTITITGEDDPLVANDESDTTDEGTAVTVAVLSNDSDPDASDRPLSIKSVSDPANGSVTQNADGTITFDPNGDFEDLGVGESRVETVDYVVENQDGDTETATLTITVTGVNDDPTANDESATTTEETTVNIDITDNDTDIDGDTVSILSIEGSTSPLVTLTSGAIVSVRPDGTIDYIPDSSTGKLDAGESTVDSFDYIVQDGKGGSATATATVTINGVDDPISANPDQETTDESTAININVLGNDSDPDSSDTLAVTGVTQPDKGKTTVNPDGTINFDPNGDFESLGAGESAVETVTYTVETPDGDTATSTLTVTINGENDGPTAEDDSASTLEQSVVNIDILANDTDPDASDNLTIQSIEGGGTLPSGATVTIELDGTVNYQPAASTNSLAAGESIIDTFDYVIVDESGATSSATATITINGENDAPTTVPDSVTITPLTETNLTGDGWGDRTAEAGGNSVTVSGNSTISSPNDDTFNNINAFSDPNVRGSDSMEIAYDGTGAGTITFTFAEAVKDPIIHIDRLGGVSNGISNSAQLTIENEGATLTRLSGTNHFEVNSTDGTISRTSGVSSSGSQSSTNSSSGTAAGSVQVNGTFTSITFSLTMLGAAGIGDAIEFGFSLTEAYYEPETINVLTNDSDAEGDALTLTAVSAPALGDVSFDPNGQITFDPGNDFDFLNEGETSVQTVTYTVRDANGATSTETASFTVEGSGHTPRVAPIVIDLDNDGAEFRSIEEGILMDVDGDGEEEQTAWAGNDDAVLIYDKNENDDVDGAEEFAFSQYVEGAESDLEGLAHFDTDGSGTLAVGDEEFSKFKLWQDKDGDGIVGEGELTSLTDAGIESIGLASDGIDYHAADGDVYVHGTSQVHYIDGTVGDAADAEFAYQDVDTGEIVQPMGAEEPLIVNPDATVTGSGVNLDEVPTTQSSNDSGGDSGAAAASADDTMTPPPVAIPVSPDDEAAAAAASSGS